MNIGRLVTVDISSKFRMWSRYATDWYSAGKYILLTKGDKFRDE
jgi:hypothetical protein